VAGLTVIPQTGSRSRIGEGSVAVTGLCCLIADALYWIRRCFVRRVGRTFQVHHTEEVEGMTYLDVVFNYGSLPGENELRAIDSMREVYGVRRVQFDNQRRTVTVEYDASRLKQDAVAKMLRQAGIDVREVVALA